MIAAFGLAASATATWFLRVVFTRMQRRFRDKIAVALEAHVATLQASVATIEHHERPEYLDRLSVLRDQVFALDHLFMSLFSTAGWIIRLGRDAPAARRGEPGARLPPAVRDPDRAHDHVAAGRGARGGGGGRAARPPRPPPLHARHHRARGQGAARRAHRRPARARPARRVGPVVPAARAHPHDDRASGTRSRGGSSARAYVGAIVYVSVGLDAEGRRRSCSS